MPRYLSARPPGDLAEAQHVRRLAHSRHAPADWITHATMVVYSWEGQRVRQIAVELAATRRRYASGSTPSTSEAWRG